MVGDEGDEGAIIIQPGNNQIKRVCRLMHQKCYMLC